MHPLLDLLQPGQLHWLTARRYAVISLPLLLASGSGMAGYGQVALLLLGAAVPGYARLVWLKLLPHEKVRLAAAEQALADALPGQAIADLQRPLRFAGMHYQVQRAALLIRAHVRQGQFIEAHAALSALDEQYLQPDERQRVQCAWAWLFLEADNPAEALRRLEGIRDQAYTTDLRSLLIKAELELHQERFMQARELLESGLDRCKTSAERVHLHNNLARLEYLQGRSDAQLRHLQAARREFDKAPRADLADIVHHNLAIALVRAGQPDEARQVLREALAAGDCTDLQHVISMLNNHLHAAREAGDAEWRRKVHAEFERQLARLPARSPREQLALDISQLRTERNDAMPRPADDYPERIERLLDSLATTQPAISQGDRVAALVELRHDLKREIEAVCGQTGSVPGQLAALLQRSAIQLLAQQATIEAYLTTLSPKLIGPLTTWHSYRTDADKARVELAESSEAIHAAVLRLFRHLREKAEWLAEQGSTQQVVEAWLIVCNEYVAYHTQLPASAQACWRKEYLALAQHALDQAVVHLEGTKNHHPHIAQMIGIAYFSLRLRQDTAAAAHWMSLIAAHRPSLDHYATWLREHYAYVCAVLESHPQSQQAAQP